MTPIGETIKGLISGATGGILKGAADIIDKFVADPDKKIEAQNKLAEIQATHEKDMADIGVKLEEVDAKKLETVNQTMREEAKSEHWAQWSWRPAVGFMFVGIGLNNYIIMPYLKNKGLLPIEVPSEMFMAILAILGVASWGRSQKGIVQAKK